MAKTTNCCFCKKELTKGFFNGNADTLEVAPLVDLTCCADCANELKKAAKAEKDRFGIKLANYKRATNSKPAKEEIAEMFLKYLDEMECNEGNLEYLMPLGFDRFYWMGANGTFMAKEYQQGFINSDASAKYMVKTLQTSMKAVTKEVRYFNKNHVTKLEFRRVGIGDPLSLTSIAYSYEIRLNDEKCMTYKPCITRTAVIGKGFLGFFCAKSASRQMQAILERFRDHIGSDLPVVEVKKFK
ncbi:MAG: hypothetical protein IKL24_04460 [Clostridia bacterium]|nr:hypothetical protein [Clostridia bacterium]